MPALPRCPAIRLPLLLAVLVLSPLAARSQQTDIRRYDLFAGFTGFETPELNLAERGFHLQPGTNLRSWLAVGFDYSVVTGHNALTPNLLKSSLQQELAAELGGLAEEGLIPAGYQLVVPTNAFSQTFAAGPQLALRRYSAVTLFVRPSLGAIRQRVTPRPKDAIATLVVEQLVPDGYKVDWSGFYGFGGGLDWNATRHFALRMQTDLVYWRLFNDLLANGTWTVRYSIGPTFRFGRNIALKSTP